MIKNRCYLSLGIFILLIASIASISAQEFTHVVSNSEDWKDVYSIMHYAKLQGIASSFLVSQKHAPLVLNSISKTNKMRVVSSTSSAFILDYKSIIESKGFSSAEEIYIDDANIDLIKDLPEIKNFIIVGDTYGYSAIAVSPYAHLTKSWVFLADRTNIDEIEVLLEDREVDEVLIYGFVDREVKNALDKYDPEIIDNGDRFKDNIEIVEKYLEIKDTEQIILTNGEFIEQEILSGSFPILFTGKENVPDQISNYIKSSDIQVGVLIGSDLVGAATNIRRGTGISVIVKFARGARAATGGIAAVEGLDLFYLPIPIMDLDIHSAKYNSASSQLELTYKSNSNIPVFFKGTITPITESGEESKIGDIEPIFIAPNDFKTVSYPDLDLRGEITSVEVFTLYGDSPTSLEKILERTIDVGTVNIIDRCEISIEEVKYSKPKEIFIVKIKNKANINCFVDVEFNEVLIDGNKKTLGSEGSEKIEPQKTENIIIRQAMSDADLEQNSLIDVSAYYGEREDNLIKLLRGRFKLKIETVSLATIGLISLIILIILTIVVLLFILWKRRKEEEDDDF